MGQENSIDWFSAYSAGLTGKEEALKQVLKNYGYATKTAKAFAPAGYAFDAIRGAGALMQGDYDEAGRRTASAIGGGIGGWLGGIAGGATGIFAPVLAPTFAAGGSYFGSWVGEQAYDHALPALRWTGNTIEGGIRDYTQNTISPWAQYFAESATESLQPLVTKWSDGLQGITNDYGPGLESKTKTMSGTIESATKAISTFAESGTKALVKLFGGDIPESSTATRADADSSYSGRENGRIGDYYLDLSTWAGTPSRHKFDADSFGISTPTLDFFASAKAPESALTTQSIRNATPNTVALPSGVDSYLDMRDFTFTDSFVPEPANDNIHGWDVADLIDPSIPLYVEPEAQTISNNYVSQQQQPTAIDYAGSAINTAYNVMSFGSTLQDVLTGRRSDPGAYLSLANSTAQGLSWLSKTEGAKEIVGAIGDLQGPLDKLGNVTGGAVAGWGLYQNIAGLANGEVTAQNVLGVAAKAG